MKIPRGLFMSKPEKGGRTVQEISLNVLDIAENSVKAGALEIRITVEEQPDRDLLTVIIEDNGCGMTPEQVTRVTDPFFTSRTTRKVGLGVPLMKMAAEMTGGRFELTSEPGRGTTVTAVFGYHHLDRMPLGDMAQTVGALIQCNPDRDFIYCHRKGARAFTVDTRQFRKVLGEEISLGEPAVAAYIRDYLTEAEQELG